MERVIVIHIRALQRLTELMHRFTSGASKKLRISSQFSTVVGRQRERDSSSFKARPELASSSLVRAGVLPRLERDSNHWIVVPPFRPRREPFKELADVLRFASSTTQCVVINNSMPDPRKPSEMAGWIFQATDELRRKKGALDATVLITVDQIEEALDDKDALGNAFLVGLRDTLALGDYRLLVLATLRSEFSATLQRHPLFESPTPTGRGGTDNPDFQLGPMPRSSFHTVIEGPATLGWAEYRTGINLTVGMTMRARRMRYPCLRLFYENYGDCKLAAT